MEYIHGNVDVWASASPIQNVNKLWLDISTKPYSLKK